MINFSSIFRKILANYPGLSGILIGFFGVYFTLSVSTAIFENFSIEITLALVLLIAIAASIYLDVIPIIIVIFTVFIPSIVVLAIISQGITVYRLAETIIEQSVAIAAIATFFIMSLKVAVEAWRVWKDSNNKEQDIKLRREIFEFEKTKERSNE